MFTFMLRFRVLNPYTRYTQDMWVLGLASHLLPGRAEAGAYASELVSAANR